MSDPDKLTFESIALVVAIAIMMGALFVISGYETRRGLGIGFGDSVQVQAAAD